MSILYYLLATSGSNAGKRPKKAPSTIARDLRNEKKY